MANSLGYSVFLSTFEKQKTYLQGVGKNNPLVFVSLHIAEEFSDTYTKDMHAMCTWLNEEGLDTHIEVDGGINEETGALCAEAGADVLVAGSYVFKNDIHEVCEKLWKLQ